jgi:hypothetical protein
MMARPQFAQENVVAFGTDSAGVANALAVLDQAGIVTHHEYTDRHRRDLFVRQQQLYLKTFGFIRQVEPRTFEVTTAGAAFAETQSDAARIRLFTEALSRKQWPFGPITFYPFFCQVIDRVPEQRIYLDEMSLIVIHSYHQAELDGIVDLVAEYRGLPDKIRNSVAVDADQQLRGLLGQYAGGTAYGRYRRKVADLMVAFGTTIDFQFVEASIEDRSYIERMQSPPTAVNA